MTVPDAIERNAKVIQLVVSSCNAIMLAIGLIAGAVLFYGDTKHSDRTQESRILKVEDRIGKIETALIGTVRDGQERTNARLTTLETQNVFIMRSLDRLEASMSRQSAPN